MHLFCVIHKTEFCDHEFLTSQDHENWTCSIYFVNKIYNFYCKCISAPNIRYQSPWLLISGIGALKKRILLNPYLKVIECGLQDLGEM